MSRPLEWAFYSRHVDTAREEILEYLPLMGNRKVIYFDGWGGFGTSAVLRSVAEVLPSRRTTPGLCFDRVIFIDCSKWKNRRALQRAIAEELKLDSSVMASLDKQDEEDDFHGVDESSRNEIDSVGEVIARTLSSTQLMTIFLNGSDAEIDLGSFGIPPFAKFGKNKLVWTFKRSCLTMHRRYPEFLDKLRYTHFSLNYSYHGIQELTSSQFQAILLEEAAAIVAHNPCLLDVNPTIVADCCLYELFLLYNFHSATKSDWVAHASNYWMCDGIIQRDRPTDITNALHREINWECDPSLLDDVHNLFKENRESPFLVIKDDDVYVEGPYRWISVTSRNTGVHGMQTIPATTSSFFLAFERSDHSPTLPNGFFKDSSKLGVLILYCCAFSFASPPFLKCNSLRFLGLDNCSDDKTIQAEDNTAEWSSLYSLWVLDLRYTDWNEILSKEKLGVMTDMRELNIEGIRCWQYATLLQGQLPNLQKLRIIKPTCRSEASKDVDNSFMDKTSMEILDLSGNSDMEVLPISLSKASSLEMLVLDGCDGLENVDAPSRVPPSLKSFSFDGYGPASQWTQTAELSPKQFRPSSRTDNKETRISKISLEGCTQLENLFLRGLPNLAELDLSGTAIKILDFKAMVVEVPRLKRLFLIGCKHLRAIIWSDERKPDLKLICIDTRAATMCQRPSIDKNKSFRLQVHAIIVDARIARSLRNLLRLYIEKKDVYFNIHITSSPVYDGAVISEAINEDKIDNSNQESLQQLIPAGRYRDVLGMVGVAPMQAFPQPPTRDLDRHVEIAEGSCYVESEVDQSLGELMHYYIESLHVHDVSVRAIISQESYMWWGQLRRCCMERCSKLDAIFSSKSYEFDKLETFWASDLLMARSIWSKGLSRLSYDSEPSFQCLQHLHLRSCPRLQSVLPVWVSSFPSLETLHIIHCGDLSHIFILDDEYPKEITTNGVPFPKLTTIHLHDLPNLQQICESFNMVAPALESIKIRGCWSLRRLPSVAVRGRGKKKPTVEIEKEVWDALEWDAGHRPDHFEAPVHSRYYKKKMPRGSVLR